MMDALNRSGYLLESEISKLLSTAGFDVETNQVILDKLTGKNREIDLIADYYETVESRKETKCYCSIHFVFEIKNNAAPIVLLTEFEYSMRIADWEGFKSRLTIPKGVEYETHETFYSKIVESEKYSKFTQYCSFQRKKANEELMALHPENIHESLGKIVQYCEDHSGIEHVDKNDLLRHFLYLPILLIRDDLYELHHIAKNKTTLKKVNTSLLVVNYHKKETPAMAYVFVVTKKAFSSFMKDMINLQREVENQMAEIKKKASHNSA